MQDFYVTSQRRKELYWWLASLFSGPLTQEDIAEYDSDDVRSFLKSLHTLAPLSDAVTHFQELLQKLTDQQNLHKRLADSFESLFYDPQTQAASLRASAYPDNSLEEPDLSQALTDWFKRYPKATKSLSDLPPDHISVQLYLMGWLALSAAETDEVLTRESLIAEQKSLIHDYLIKWLDIFTQQVQAKDQLGFYGAISVLMMSILHMDEAYLKCL